MKIAISSSGNTAQALVDKRFGRCAYFAIYDTEEHELSFVENPNKNAEGGAGPASVGLIANHGANKIVSGEFGFKIKDMLNDLHIQMIIMKEEKTIQEIIDLVK